MLLELLILSLASQLVLSKDIKDLSVPELIQLAEDVTQLQPTYFTDTDVSFYLFTRTITNLQIFLNATETVLDPTKSTKILIHGWLETHSQSWYEEITREYLKKGDYQVIQVDWGRVARTIYVSSAENTKFVGDDVAILLLSHKLPPEVVHLIGHSLGAHAAGFAAKKYAREAQGRKVARITALDAAGPYFKEFFIDEAHRLAAKDAQIVDAIHTDGGVYGYDNPIGTLDVYMNGGRGVQPDCYEVKLVPLGEAVENSFCSHTRSHYYFTQMINARKYHCVKCESWERFLQGKCSGKETYLIGAEDVTADMTGVCYVKTGRKAANKSIAAPFLDSLLQLDVGNFANIFTNATKLF